MAKTCEKHNSDLLVVIKLSKTEIQETFKNEMKKLRHNYVD